ncbi:MAG TPA: SDR family NAD(P)-dependent oxidoreductase [Candidatus Acidoferrales bacterium]|nr:SDR family NAD(P)-dependent oxidoreductase [Candidatus Acidoferrales bacterium]
MSRTIIVTGGAGGIGSEICRGLARDGLRVVIADYDANAARSLAGAIAKEGAAALPVQVDVGDKASVEQMVQATLLRFGEIDFLLNGAGIITRTPVKDMPEEHWDRVLRVNLKGVFLCCQAVIPHMIENRRGRIISIASGRGLAGQPNAAHYAASKAGVIAFTKSLAQELAPYNVTANTIAPGATDTPMARGRSSEEEWKKREAVPPLMGGLTQKDEIVGLIRYLLSEPARFITGQTFLLRTPR